jgi:hypothetical protein
MRKSRGLLGALSVVVATAALGCASASPQAPPPRGFHCETTHHNFNDARDWANDPSRCA